MEWSNDVIMEFLGLYESEQVIWNPQHADHKDRSKNYEAWKRIQEQISVECSCKDLKKKKENLMATYRKLALKVMKNKGGEAYKPEWFAYEKMASFLHNIYTPRKTITSDMGLENEWDADDIPPSAVQVVYSQSDADWYDTDTNTAEEAKSEEGEPLATKRRKKDEQLVDLGEAFNHVNSFPKALETKDECSLFCELLCFKLRALNDDVRDLAMHEINNLMFTFKTNRRQ